MISTEIFPSSAGRSNRYFRRLFQDFPCRLSLWWIDRRPTESFRTVSFTAFWRSSRHGFPCAVGWKNGLRQAKGWEWGRFLPRTFPQSPLYTLWRITGGGGCARTNGPVGGCFLMASYDWGGTKLNCKRACPGLVD